MTAEPRSSTNRPAEQSAAPVASGVSAPGTSEGAPALEGLHQPAIAREGLADGETDNRVPPTSTF